MVANQQEKRERHVAYFLDHVPAVKTRGFGPNFDHFLPINGQYTRQYAFSDAGYSLRLSVKQSVKTSARYLARGSPTCEAPWGFRPTTKAWKRPAPARNEAEPQAEPSDSLPDSGVKCELVPPRQSRWPGSVRDGSADVRRTPYPWPPCSAGSAGAGIPAVRNRSPAILRRVGVW